MKTLTKEEAKLYLEHFSVIPINQDKTPAVSTWKAYETTKIDAAHLEANHTGRIALICGFEGLEVIDVDLKHIEDEDQRANFWNNYLQKLKDNIENFEDKFVIYSTVNKGYHIIYKTDEPGRNTHLAKLKANNKAVIETRGGGGYVFCYPNNQEAKLNYFEVKKIDAQDKATLFNCSRFFNEVEDKPTYTPTQRPQANQYNGEGIRPGDDYNAKHDILDVIKEELKPTKETAKFIHVLRTNGNTTSKDSGKIFKDTGKLFLHTPNTIYPQEELLTPFGAYAYKHHGGDFKAATKELARQGYGEQRSTHSAPHSLINTYTAADYPQEAANNEEAKPSVTIPTPQDNKELTIVNDTTAANMARFNGLSNVIHLEEKELNQGAINDALSKGYKRFNLHLDSKQLNKAIDELLKANVKLIYVASELTPQAIEKAPSYYTYKLNAILSHYDNLISEREDQALTFKEIDELKEKIVTTADTIRDAIDSKQFTNMFLQSPYVKALGIDAKALSETIKDIRERREQREAIEKLKTLNSKLTAATNKGDLTKVFDLHKEAKLIELKSKATDLSNLLTNTPIEEIREQMQNKPADLFTGYTIEGTPLSLPAGALTVIAGATGHGKTSFMTNIAVNLVKLYQDKQVYFFSYEEDTPALVRNAINVFTAEHLSKGNRRTIDSYLKDNTVEYADADKRQIFKSKALRYEREIHNNNRLVINKVDDFKAEHLCTAIEHLKESSPNIAAVFVDYIQLIYLEDASKAYGRQDELKRITDQLKQVAVSTGLPIILGAQFNREVRNPLHLDATYIREAADIEHSASLVLGVWNNSKNYGYKNVSESDKKHLKHFFNNGLIPTIEESLAYIKGQPSTMYTKILKNRTGVDGLEEAFYWNGNIALIRNAGAKPGEYKEIAKLNHQDSETPFNPIDKLPF